MRTARRRQLKKSSLYRGRWLKKFIRFLRKIGWHHQFPLRVTPSLVTPLPFAANDPYNLTMACRYRTVQLLTFYYLCTVHRKTCRTSCVDSNGDPRQCTPGTTGTCHQHATCTRVTPYVCACNPASSYRCQCNPGFTGDGLDCTGGIQKALLQKTKLWQHTYRQLRQYNCVLGTTCSA